MGGLGGVGGDRLSNVDLAQPLTKVIRQIDGFAGIAHRAGMFVEFL